MSPSETLTFQYVSNLRNALYETETHDGEMSHLLVVFSRVLEKRYAHVDLNGCVLFQLVAASSMSGASTRFDFPGDDSIQTFLEELAASRIPEAFAKLKEEFERECGRQKSD